MSPCNNCGAALAPAQAKCVYCGTAASSSARVAAHPPSAPTPPPAAPVTGPAKSKVAAGVLGILLGGLGVHNFYLGFPGKGAAQLLLTVLTCGYGGLISWTWGVVEGIMILTGSINKDGRGVPLAD